MSFCPKCNNILDISRKSLKFSPQLQLSQSQSQSQLHKGGSAVDKIIDNITNNNIDFSEEDIKQISQISLENIVKDNAYKKLDVKNKSLVYNKIADMKKEKLVLESKIDINKNKIFYICKNCSYEEEIKNGELIFSKNGNISNKNNSGTLLLNDNELEYINDMTLPRTRNYICPNISCHSHKDPSQREAIFFRENIKSYTVKYICISCKTLFRI